MKTCTECGESKDLAKFYTRYTKCRACVSQAGRDRWKTDAAFREEKIRKGTYWNQGNPLRVMLSNAKLRAKKYNREFSITLSDLVLPETCPILGIPLEFSLDRAKANSPTLDRIDNTKGYIPGNVWIISRRANMMKNDASTDELLVFAEWVTREYGHQTEDNPSV